MAVTKEGPTHQEKCDAFNMAEINKYARNGDWKSVVDTAISSNSPRVMQHAIDVATEANRPDIANRMRLPKKA